MKKRGRLFFVAGVCSLAAAATVLTRYHYDFAAGYGYGFGAAAVIAGLLFMRRERGEIVTRG